MLAQPSSRFTEPTIDIVKSNFGDRVEIRDGLEGTASVISTAKAPAHASAGDPSTTGGLKGGQEPERPVRRLQFPRFSQSKPPLSGHRAPSKSPSALSF